jgi:hypothetical protein
VLLLRARSRLVSRRVDERHLILAREVCGPWMRENIRPLLAGDTKRSVGEVIVSAGA